MTKEKPFPIPVNYFGMVLGLAAFGLAWRYGTTVIALSVSIGETLLFAAGAFWLCFVLAYIYKWVAYRKQAQEELRHPILGCFVSLIPITTMLIGLAALPYFESSGSLLFSPIVVPDYGKEVTHLKPPHRYCIYLQSPPILSAPPA